MFSRHVTAKQVSEHHSSLLVLRRASGQTYLVNAPPAASATDASTKPLKTGCKYTVLVSTTAPELQPRLAYTCKYLWGG